MMLSQFPITLPTRSGLMKKMFLSVAVTLFAASLAPAALAAAAC